MHEIIRLFIFVFSYSGVDLQGNKDLADISHVIVDEVHERSLLVS